MAAHLNAIARACTTLYYTIAACGVWGHVRPSRLTNHDAHKWSRESRYRVVLSKAANVDVDSLCNESANTSLYTAKQPPPPPSSNDIPPRRTALADDFLQLRIGTVERYRKDRKLHDQAPSPTHPALTLSAFILQHPIFTSLLSLYFFASDLCAAFSVSRGSSEPDTPPGAKTPERPPLLILSASEFSAPTALWWTAGTE